MDPYETPEAVDVVHNTAEQKHEGEPCRECESTNTTEDSVLKSKPSILTIILFGWPFLLIRGALAMRTVVCRDCGSSYRYKSLGSWIVLCLVLFAAMFFIAGLFLS